MVVDAFDDVLVSVCLFAVVLVDAVLVVAAAVLVVAPAAVVVVAPAAAVVAAARHSAEGQKRQIGTKTSLS